jgi:hypothetical protein
MLMMSLNCGQKQLIYEHGEPWWSDIDRGKTSDSFNKALCSTASRSSRSKSGGTEEGNNKFGLTEYLCAYFEGIFNMPQNLTTWGCRLSFPSQGRRAADFYRP